MKNIKYVICLAIIALLVISCGNKNITDPTNTGTPTIPPPEFEVTVPWDGTTSTEPDIENNAYSIKTAENLAWLGAQTTIIDKDITFVSNVDMNNYHFDGIAEYTGTINGNNKIIKNIMMDGSTDNAGLINAVGGDVTIKDLGLEGGSIKGKNRAGGLIATATAATLTIENSYNTADISAATTSGGLIGFASLDTPITIENSYNTGNVSTSASFSSSSGGLIAYLDSGSDTIIKNSYNSGNVSSPSYAGGLIAHANSSLTVTIENSYNTGDIFSPLPAFFTSPPEPSLPPLSSSGGLIAFAADFSTVTIQTSFSYGNIEGMTIGGIIGYGTTSRESLNNYWYSSSTGTINTVGGTKLTADAFKQSGNFTGFDFGTVWNAPETTGKNYPTLK